MNEWRWNRKTTKQEIDSNRFNLFLCDKYRNSDGIFNVEREKHLFTEINLLLSN